MNKIKKVVFTGGPYSGKSTLVSEFESLGYPVAKEAALLVIEDLNNEIGIEEQVKFRSEHIHEFQRLIFNKQVELEHEAFAEATKYNLDFIICDRGVYDGITYYKLFNKNIDEELLNDIYQHQYDNVFVCEVLPNFDARNETGRFENIDISKQLSELSYDTYNSVTQNVLWLPVMSIEDRVNFVINYIS